MHRTPQPPGGVVLREFWADLLALVWPTECVSCGAPDRDLCRACIDEVRAAPPDPPDRSGCARAGVGRIVRGTVPGAGDDIPLLAARTYDGAVRALIVAVKHHGRVGFSRRLGPLLAVPLAIALTLREDEAPPLLVCVPSRGARVRQRGYRHVELVLRGALSVLARTRTAGARTPRPARILRPLPGRTGQVGLAHGDRVRNAQRIAVSRRCAARAAGREAILIDDVVTTGATVAAACDALAAAGLRVVAVVALCVVERRDTREAGA